MAETATKPENGAHVGETSKGVSAVNAAGSVTSKGVSYASNLDNSRTVLGFMGTAMIFSIIGIEASGGNVGTKKTKGLNVGRMALTPFVVLAGGTAATAILVLIAESGEIGRRFAVGTAALTMLTAVLVNGKPVWDLLGKTVGAPKAVPATGQTTPTAPLGGQPLTMPTASTMPTAA